MAEIKKINTELQPIDKLLDTSGDAGTSGQILSTTGSGTNWIDNNTGSVTGTGADEQVTYWTSTTVIDGDDGFKYNKIASNNSIITLTSTGLQALSFVDSNSAYADAMSILRDSDKLSLTYGHNANEEALTIVGGTGSDLGFIGIGTTSPQQKLHVYTSSNTVLLVEGNQSTRFATLQLKNAVQSWMVRLEGTSEDFTIRDDTAASEPFRINPATSVGSNDSAIIIDGDANVGIGVSDPDSRLEIKGAGATTGLTLKTTDSSGNTGFWTQDGGATGVHYYPFVVGMDHDDAKPSNTLLYAKTASGSEGGLFVKTDGNVGIGTVLPVDNAGWAGLTLSGTTGGQIDFQDDGTTMGAIYNGTWGLAVQAVAGKELRLYGGGSTTLTLDSSQNSTFAGNIDVQGNSATIGSSSQTTTTLNLTATNTAGSPANAIEVIMTGYEGRGIGTFYKDTTYSGAEWFNGIIYSGSFANYAIGYDATGGQAEYAANSLLTIYKTGAATFAGTIDATTATFSAAINTPSAFNFTANTAQIKVGTSWNTGVLQFLNGATTAIEFDIPNGRIKNNLGKYLTSSGGNLNYFGSLDNYSMSLVTNNVPRLTIDNAGDTTFTGTVTVGTGTVAAPNAAADDFVIKGPGTTATGMTISNTSDSGVGTIFFGDSSSSTAAGFRYDHNTGDMAISAEDDINFTCDRIWVGGNLSITQGSKLYLDGGTHTYITEESDSNLKFYVAASQRLLLTNTTAAFAGQVSSAATSASDGNTILTTKGYVDGLITGATIYQGTWDARTSAEGGSGAGGNPDLTAGSDGTSPKINGYYYVVSNTGSATPNDPGTTPDSWHVGDWVIWNDHTGSAEWQKIDNSSVLSGTGQGQTVALWQGTSAVTDSETLGNAPLTFSTNDATFAGNIAVTGNVDVNAGEIQMDDNYSIQWGGNAILKHTGSATNIGDNSSTTALVLSGGDATFAQDITVRIGNFKSPDATASTLMNLMANDGSNAATFRTTATGKIFEIRSQNSGTLKFDSTSSTFTGKVNVQGSPPITPNTNFDDIVITDSAHAGMSIFSGGTTNHGAIYFCDDDANNVGQIKYLHNNDTMTFATAAGSASLTLDSGSGATFAGTITTTGTLTVNSGHVNIDSGYSFQWGDTHERIEQSEGKIEFFTNNTEQMTLSGSNLGLGTDTPDERLHILDNSGAKIILNTNATTADSGIYMSEGANGTPTQNGAYMYYDATGNNFKIATGTTSLTDRLTIARDTGAATFADNVTLSSSSSKGLYVKSTANVEPFIALQRNSGSNGVGVLRLLDGGDLTFDTGATGAGQTTRLTIDGATGNATFAGDVTIDGTLTEEGSGSNKTYTWRTPSSTSWSGGVKNVKFGRIYWCPNHWTNGAVINITLQGSYYAGVERKYTVTAQYQDTDPIIQQLSVADTDNKIALKVGATTSAGYNYSGQPVYYADLNFICQSYMVGWCIVKSQMPFLTANPTSTWGGIVMDATLTEPDTSATFPDSYNTTFIGDIIIDSWDGGDAMLQLESSSQALRIDQNSIRSTTSSNIAFLTNHVLALTLDTSQNATFAGTLASGNISVTGGGGGNGQIDVLRTSGANVRIQSQSATGVLGVTTNHPLHLKTNDTTRVTIAAGGDATFAADVRAGESQNAASYLKVTNENAGVSATARVVAVGESSQIDMIAASAGYTGVTGWADSGIISTDSGASGGLILNAVTGGVQIQTAQTTALTINASQNATFAGIVTINGTETVFNPDGDSTAKILNAGTDAIALFAGVGDTLYLGGNNTTGVYLDTSANAYFQGHIHLLDSKYVYWGNANDFYIGHAVTETNIINSTGTLNIEQHADNADIVFKCDNGSGGVTNYLVLDGEKELISAQKDIYLDGNVNIVLDTTLATSQTSGTVINIDDQTVSPGEVYIRGESGGSGLWSRTTAGTESFSGPGLLAYSLGTNAQDDGMLLNGVIYDLSHGFTIGLPIYIGTTTGTLTTTAPSGSGEVVRIVGYALDANHIYFCPDTTWVLLD